MAARERAVLVLHGPNLNRLGARETSIYGTQTLAEVDAALAQRAAELGATVVCRQSNHEGELVGWIQEAEGAFAAILINPAAYTHTSVAIRDALQSISLPAFEVHISNVYAREPFRATSYCADIVVGRIMGFGTAGYLLALEGAIRHLDADEIH